MPAGPPKLPWSLAAARRPQRAGGACKPASERHAVPCLARSPTRCPEPNPHTDLICPAPPPGATGGGPALEALLRAFSLLAPEQFNAFSAARYETDHHIAPHDDRAYTPVQLDSGGGADLSGMKTL